MALMVSINISLIIKIFITLLCPLFSEITVSFTKLVTYLAILNQTFCILKNKLQMSILSWSRFWVQMLYLEFCNSFYVQAKMETEKVWENVPAPLQTRQLTNPFSDLILPSLQKTHFVPPTLKILLLQRTKPSFALYYMLIWFFFSV